MSSLGRFLPFVFGTLLYHHNNNGGKMGREKRVEMELTGRLEKRRVVLEGDVFAEGFFKFKFIYLKRDAS